MGERSHGMREVAGSIPAWSTMKPTKNEILRAFGTLWYARQPEQYAEGDRILKEVIGPVSDYPTFRAKLFDHCSDLWSATTHKTGVSWEEVERLLA